MSKSVTTGHAVSMARDPAPQPDEIRRQLQHILASPVFHGSKRCQQFLEYVCVKSLAGEAGALKERTVAVEVFGRPPHIDLGEDTIVRVGAREVRKRLAQYYITPDGASAEIRIDLPSGSYAPEFRYMIAVAEREAPVLAPSAPPVVPEKVVAPDPAAQPVVAVVANGSKSRKLVPWVGIAGALALVTLVALRVTAPGPNMDAFLRFWDPVLRSREPLLIAMAHPIVYHPSARALRLSEQNLPPQEIPMQRPIQVSPKDLDATDLVTVQNQYVGFGDMIAANEVSAMLARKSHPVKVRLASGLEFADLRNVQTLLIGAVTNRWTMEMEQTWRFRFSWKPDTRTVIVDTQAPPESGRQWSIVAQDDGSAPEDYILVCRIHSQSTGGWLMVGAGLKQFGTEAAGHLLADPEQLGAILSKLPAGWENKNLQLVLHAKVIRNTPALPDVVASYVW
jgi:hypothetical protein